jgi:hypothetical protein
LPRSARGSFAASAMQVKLGVLKSWVSIEKRINAATAVSFKAIHGRSQELVGERLGTRSERLLPRLSLVPEALHDVDLGTRITTLDS